MTHMDKVVRIASLSSSDAPHIRTAEDGSEQEAPLTVRGHAAVFNERTLIGSPDWGFVERIAPGAFQGSLNDDVRFLSNHGGEPFARTTNGTLRLAEDSRGLMIEADLNPNMQAARDHFAAIDRGDIDQMSFAFTIEEETLRQLPDDDPEFPGMVERVVNRTKGLFDVSGVTYPAYLGADIGVRSHDERIRQDIEGVLSRASNEGLVTDVPEIPSEQNETKDGMSVERAKALAAAQRHLTNKEIHNG